MEEKLLWVIETIKKTSATDHTLYVIADAKAFCSILYSSGNIQIKSCWDPVKPDIKDGAYVTNLDPYSDIGTH